MGLWDSMTNGNDYTEKKDSILIYNQLIMEYHEYHVIICNNIPNYMVTLCYIHHYSTILLGCHGAKMEEMEVYHVSRHILRIYQIS